MRCAFLSRAGLLAAPLLLAVTSIAVARSPFVMIDKNGKTVGPIIDMPDGDNGRARIPFRVSDQRIMLVLSRTGFDKKGYLHFESADCSGQPYIVAESIDVLTDAKVGGALHSLYVGDGEVHPVDVRSHLNLVDEKCTPFQVLSTWGRPARHVVDLATRFTPPFRVSAAPDVTDLNVP